MKAIRSFILIMAVIAISSVALQAQTGKSGTQSFKVEGKCEMCKERIETAAKGVKGVKSAVWDVKTHLLAVNLSASTDIALVGVAVAKAGHDNGKNKADDKIYKALPMCCKYRK